MAGLAASHEERFIKDGEKGGGIAYEAKRRDRTNTASERGADRRRRRKTNQ